MTEKAKSKTAGPKMHKINSEKELLNAHTQLTKEVNELTKEVEKLKDLEFLQVFKHPWKFMGFSLLKGIMVGFGSVLGASVLVALVVYILAQISFVPLVGDFVQDIINQIQPKQNNSQNENRTQGFIEMYEAKKADLATE